MAQGSYGYQRRAAMAHGIRAAEAKGALVIHVAGAKTPLLALGSWQLPSLMGVRRPLRREHSRLIA
jgi:hypothetical protein